MVSIIIPAYNCGKTITDTLDSIVNQTYTDYEIIIINDGSIDDTEDIVLEYMYCHSDILIYYYKQDNQGPGSARNNGIHRACGDFIVFVDSDDCLITTYLESLLEGMNDSCDMCVGEYYRIIDKQLESKKLVTQKFYGICKSEKVFSFFICNQIYISLWNSIFRRSIINNNFVNFVDNSYSGEDIRFISEYLLFTKRVNIINKPVYYYNYSTARNNDRANNSEMMSIYDSIFWPLVGMLKEKNWTIGLDALINGKLALISIFWLINIAKSSSSYRSFITTINEKGSSFIEYSHKLKPTFFSKTLFLKAKVLESILSISYRLFYYICLKIY